MPEFTAREVEQSHIIADLTTDLAKSRRIVVEVRDLLRDVPHMLDHDRAEVAREFVDRALQKLIV